MNRKVSSVLLAAGLAAGLAMTSVSAFAQHWHGGGPRWHSGVSIGVGIGPYWGPGYYGGGPYYNPYYAPAPVIVERPVYQAPPVYIEQAQTAPAPQQAPDYWYYCAASKSYYPYVQNCPAGWMRVAPNTAPGGPPR